MMKKLLKSIGLIFVLCIILSYCIPKGGPDWFHKRSKYFSEGNPSTYEIVVDFSKPSCEDRLFIYDCSIDVDLVYSGVVPTTVRGRSYIKLGI